MKIHAIWCSILALFSSCSMAQPTDELAKQLSSPVASLISVPIQFNYDNGGGPNHDGERWTLNFQPVIPISISNDWNLISRTHYSAGPIARKLPQ